MISPAAGDVWYVGKSYAVEVDWRGLRNDSVDIGWGTIYAALELYPRETYEALTYAVGLINASETDRGRQLATPEGYMPEDNWTLVGLLAPQD